MQVNVKRDMRILARNMGIVTTLAVLFIICYYVFSVTGYPLEAERVAWRLCAPIPVYYFVGVAAAWIESIWKDFHQ
jgi:hypothetical protein